VPFFFFNNSQRKKKKKKKKKQIDGVKFHLSLYTNLFVKIMPMLESLKNVELLKIRHKLLKVMMGPPTKPNYLINSS